ncbi:MAG: hypothetical protein ACI9MC_003837 [Kiritimatiellia bacterium]
MTNSVFHRLHRIRKLEQQRAQMDKMQAANTRDDKRAEVIRLEHHAVRSSTLFNDKTPGAISHHHAFAIHNEMQRRGAVVNLWTADEQLQNATRVYVERAVQARSVELLAEAHEEREALEARSSEEGELDEVGTQQWIRRAS